MTNSNYMTTIKINSTVACILGLDDTRMDCIYKNGTLTGPTEGIAALQEEALERSNPDSGWDESTNYTKLQRKALLKFAALKI